MYHSSAASTRCHAFTSRAVSAARRHSIFCRYAAITRLRTLPDVGSPDPPCFRFSWSTDFGSFGPIKYSKRASLYRRRLWSFPFPRRPFAAAASTNSLGGTRPPGPTEAYNIILERIRILSIPVTDRRLSTIIPYNIHINKFVVVLDIIIMCRVWRSHHDSILYRCRLRRRFTLTAREDRNK